MSGRKVKLIKVENNLRKKVGYGKISEESIARAETLLQGNNIDFRDIARGIFENFRKDLAIARGMSGHDPLLKERLINSVMELKANAPMFKYELVGDLASIVLSFLEHIKELDKDAISIIEAHEKTLSIIIAKSIMGRGGALGEQLVSELESACARYYRKNPEKFKKPV